MRSQLFVPADSEKKLEKSLSTGADCLLIDLEDSVALAAKPRARLAALAFLYILCNGELPAKEIGLGDLYAATSEDWLAFEDKALAPLLKRAKSDATAALNETTLAQVVKRLKKS